MNPYPTGPPTCGSSDDPTCKPLITNMSNGGPLAVFSFWILVFVVVTSFQIYRAIYVKRHPYSPVTRGGKDAEKESLEMHEVQNTAQKTKKDTNAADSKIVVDEEEEPMLRFTGYKTVICGEICCGLLILTSVLWIVLYLLVLLDAYYSCQVTSMDNLCFFGTYFIFGSPALNGKVFFTVWCISAIWFTAMVVYGKEMHNWFRIPCSLDRAHVVHVWAQDQEEVISIRVSFIVKFVRKVKGLVSRSKISGHTETIPITQTDMGTLYFLFQGQRYLIEDDKSLHSAKVEVGHTYRKIYELSGGLSKSEATTRYDKLGPNEVPFKQESIWTSMAEEMITLFKVYQFLIYSVWFWFSYLFVTAVLVTIVMIAATISIINRRRSQSVIAKLTEYESVVEVKRDGSWESIDYRLLVPGDVVQVKNNWKLPSDLLIIQGICICNESNLTGEAMPVQKYTAPNNDDIYDPEDPKGERHTLFSGTEVLQAGLGGSTEVLGIVTATGMNTSKGKLLSAILFPKQMIFKYDEELPIVAGMLLFYAIICFILSIVFQRNNGNQSDWVTKWTYCVNIVSQVLSPLLPIALEIGQIYASDRLKKNGIYCLNPKRIAIVGKIRLFCFDKTGTLTKSSLDFVGVQGIVVASNNRPHFGPTLSPLQHDLIDKVILRGFATCHSVTKFGDQFMGNEVEVKMFSSVGWNLDEDIVPKQYLSVFDKSGDEYKIVRRNEFEHARATMSVVIQDKHGELHVYCKGSFEKIQDLSVVESLPLEYLKTAKDHALNGCYVLGLSYKSLGSNMSLEAAKMLSRDDVEKDLTFVSLLLFRNELKPDTRDAIDNLRDAEVRPLMVTGDNAQCGFYIAKECNMIDTHVQVLLAEIGEEGSVVWHPMVAEASIGSSQKLASTTDMLKVHQDDLQKGHMELAVTGKAFNELYRIGRIQELLLYTRIFARFTPEDKVKVVNMHMDLGLVVAMCGDGGNDCGALRSAHVGLALSEAEASVVSPFTSKEKSVSSAVVLLREGRAALHTSFACYKFLIMYGLSFSILQLISNWYGVQVCQLGYLFIDGVAVLTLGYSMNLSNPKKTLLKARPTSSLIGPLTVASVLGMWIINILFVVGALSFMSAQDDYRQWPSKLSEGKAWWTLGDNWEATVLYFTIYFQFITSSVVFSFGSSFRRTIFRNNLLLVSWTSIFVLISSVLLLPHSSFTHLWHVASEDFNGPNPSSPVWAKYQEDGNASSPAMSFDFRIKLWFIMLSNLIIIAFWQKVVVEGPIAKVVRRKFPSPTPKFRL